jgi:hypothetical protein
MNGVMQRNQHREANDSTPIDISDEICHFER